MYNKLKYAEAYIVYYIHNIHAVEIGKKKIFFCYVYGDVSCHIVNYFILW